MKIYRALLLMTTIGLAFLCCLQQEKSPGINPIIINIDLTQEGTPFTTQTNLNNVGNLERSGKIIAMSATRKEATNTFSEPMRISLKTI